MTHITLAHVRAALALTPFDSQAAHYLMAPLARPASRPAELPGAARIGSVLLLLYCHREELHLALTRRRDDLNSHAGQVSFPGGRAEAGETLAAAALRETEEEVGVRPSAITILGELTPIWIPPSDFEVHPFVGWAYSGVRPSFQLAENEVAELLETPLSYLLHPDSRREGIIERQEYRLTVPYFDVEGHMVWGATAIILSEFLERLRSVARNP
ncbi:MAG: coenzyme A pyrophosphatase [Chloroflexota bacterium]|nr:CoA pyrophosphatase [Ardenticatenaceae bacterium]GIK57790.1 MAG: coenzyme A pyrophosphatase [Chloroflexota bacterium]